MTRSNSPGLLRTVLVLLAVGAVVGGCTGNESEATDPGDSDLTTTTTTTTAEADSALAHYLEMDAVPQAIMQGLLVLDGSCLVLQGTGQEWLAVWPPGATLDRSPTAGQVLSADGDVLAVVGEELRMGGGEVSWNAPAAPSSEWRDRCPTETWALLYPLPDDFPDG